MLLGILLISNLDKAVTTHAPDKLRLIIQPPKTIEQVADKYPELTVDPDTNTVETPAGQRDEYARLLVQNKDALEAVRVETEPALDWQNYRRALQDKTEDFREGDLGGIAYNSNWNNSYSIKDMLPDMIIRSLSYLLPGLLLGVAAGYAFALLAVIRPKLGNVLDGLHSIILSMPDFFVVVLLQMLALIVDRATNKPTILVIQFGDQVPLLVPILAISILPATLIYGTLRIAIEREWAEGYVKTAYAKGLASLTILFRHILSNTMEDLMTIMPRAVTVGVTSMAVAEVMCMIFGLGGYVINPSVSAVTSLTTTCAILAVITMLLHLLFFLIRKKFVVNTSEGGA